MRPPLPLALSLLLVLPAVAQADDDTKPQLSSHQCGISTDFNVLVDGGGVWLYRDAGVPKEVFFHDGELSVDRQVRDVSAEDAQRLRELEYQSRLLMPEVTEVARESVQIGFDALAGVVETMTGSARQARKIETFRQDALTHVDGTLGRGRWDQEVFDETFDAKLEEAAESMASSLGRSVMWAMFTGGADRIEKRAEKMEADLERQLEQRARGLEARADGLCTRVRAMDALQAQLQFRYEGQPLQLLKVDQRQDQDQDQPITAQAQRDTAR